MKSVVFTALMFLAVVWSTRSTRPTFQRDVRYQRTVAFEFLDLAVPIAEPGRYVRFDGVVPDLDAHQARLKREFAISEFRFTNAAMNGRTTMVAFAAGQRAAVVAVKANDNPRLVAGSLAHEKYHVVVAFAPEGVARVERALAAKGFPVRLRDFDEESAASIVQVAAIHLDGMPLEELDGSELIEKAVGILKQARRGR